MRGTKATAAFRIPETDLTEVAGNDEMANTETQDKSWDQAAWTLGWRSSEFLFYTVKQGGKLS